MMNVHFNIEDGHLTDGHLLDVRTNTSLACPDFNVMRSERRDRTRATMQALDPGLTKTVLPQAESLSNQEKAAICIQSYFRGFVARKKYVEILYDQFNKEEEWRAARTQRQVEEGELLIENHKLELEFEENHCVRRNKLQRFTTHVITIQRAWRRFKRGKLKTSPPRPSIQTDPDHHHSNGGGGGGHNADEDDDDDDDDDKDANGNRTGEARDVSLGEGERDQVKRPSGQRVDGKTHQEGASLDWVPADPDISLVNMTSARRSKAQQAMLQDLGSSVELDDNHHAYESSPEVSDKKKNRLSLAEEFAAAMDEDDGMTGDVADCEDSDPNDSELESSSCATTPEWDICDRETRRQEDSELFLEVPTLALLADDLRSKCVLQGKETNPRTMQDKQSIPDPNKNYSVESDPNANNVSFERCELTGGTKRETNSQSGDKKRNVECQDEALRTASSPNRTLGSHQVTHSKLQRCASADCRDSEVNKPVHGGVVLPCAKEQDLVCVEPTMPVLDWESLEKHLAKMEKEEEQQSYKQTQKHSRQAILRKLAMGTDDEAEGDIYGKSKDKLSTRLQSGMNLQICFVNEPADGSDLEEDSPRILAAEESTRKESHITNRFGRVTGASRLGGAGIRLSRESSNTSATSPKAPSVTFEDEEDFETKQARLQDEARIALARAEPLARMQMEFERQQRKKSPAGVSGMTDISDRLYGKKFTQRALKNMSVSKLQFVVNDLHSQIESLNEELVQLLIRRDELQMEQDSKLIDIEDLTRHATEQQQQQHHH